MSTVIEEESSPVRGERARQGGAKEEDVVEQL